MQPFWLRPKWVAGHLLAVTTVVVFVALGLWQLDRLEQRLSHNALVSARGDAPPAELETLLDAPPEAVAFRPVRVAGTYEHGGEVLLSLRTRGGRAGHHVLTPLRTRAGTLVVVDRGWVPMEWDEPPLREAAPPAGEVEVTGVARPPVPARRAGRFDGGSGPLQFVSSVDLDRIGAALGEPVAPLYVQAHVPAAGPDGYPLPPDTAPLEEGNHRSYALQWFLFAGVVAAGYPLLLRRTARDARVPQAPAAGEGERPRAGARP